MLDRCPLPTELTVRFRFRRIACRVWGDSRLPITFVCLHAVTRNSRDFEVLAPVLAERGRVLCPDFLGHGNSEFLGVAGDYPAAFFAEQMRALREQLQIRKATWVGTSLGGYVAMMMAAELGQDASGLILNDAAPYVPPLISKASYMIARVAPVRFATFEDALDYHCTTLAGFGPLAPEQRREFTAAGVREAADGSFELAYDRAMYSDFAKRTLGLDLWREWERIVCPTLLMRGGKSAVVTSALALRMASTGPRAKVVEFPECAHAPSLRTAEQVATIRDWLETVRSRAVRQYEPACTSISDANPMKRSS